MTFFKINQAWFFDQAGTEVGTKKFKNTAKTIKFKEGQYNHIPKEATRKKIKGWFVTKYIYFYNIEDPNPILLDKKKEPILNAEAYNVQLETKAVRDINNYNASLNMMEWLKNPKVWLGALIVIGGLIYMLTEGLA